MGGKLDNTQLPLAVEPREVEHLFPERAFVSRMRKEFTLRAEGTAQLAEIVMGVMPTGYGIYNDLLVPCSQHARLRLISPYRRCFTPCRLFVLRHACYSTQSPLFPASCGALRDIITAKKCSHSYTPFLISSHRLSFPSASLPPPSPMTRFLHGLPD